MIPKHMHLVFEHLVESAENGTLALVESRDRHSGAVRYVLASVHNDDGEYRITPFGHLSENPFDEYEAPVTNQQEKSNG